MVARPRGDEFAVLVIDSYDASVQELTIRISDAFAAASIAASLAGAAHVRGEALMHTWVRADSAMYDHKRTKQQ